MPRTLVSLHAHPDDEVLLTGGTLARAARDGHRVVLVVATGGDHGLADPRVVADRGLGTVREGELRRAAGILGVSRVVLLGYRDSGLRGEVRAGDAFANVVPRAAAARVAEILVAERADVLTSYDARGGYGHPDHRQVHRVGSLAASIAGTPLLLEATVDQTWIRRLAPGIRLIPGGLGGVGQADLRTSYTPRREITHRIDVREFADVKRAAMQAHVSQAGGGQGPRTLAMLLRLPPPVFRAVLGTEWFVQAGRRPAGPPLDDVFAGLPALGATGG